ENPHHSVGSGARNARIDCLDCAIRKLGGDAAGNEVGPVLLLTRIGVERLRISKESDLDGLAPALRGNLGSAKAVAIARYLSERLARSEPAQMRGLIDIEKRKSLDDRLVVSELRNVLKPQERFEADNRAQDADQDENAREDFPPSRCHRPIA